MIVALAVAASMSSCQSPTDDDSRSGSTENTDGVGRSRTPRTPVVFPDAGSTGVPAGTQLEPSDGMRITEDNTVIDGLHVRGSITIDADNVTIRNTLVQTGTSLYPINVANDTTGTLIENVEVDNEGGTGIGIFLQGTATVRKVNVHSAEDGIRIQEDDVLIEDSYIHDLQPYDGGHHDTIQIRSGDDVTLRGNNLQAYVPSLDTPLNASLQIGSLAGDDPISNLRVIGNLMNGGNFTINGGRSGDTDSAYYADNQFGTDYRYGAVGNLQDGSVWTYTNVWHHTGGSVR